MRADTNTLRLLAKEVAWQMTAGAVVARDMYQAADEIERLRAKEAEAADEIERLQAELGKVRSLLSDMIAARAAAGVAQGMQR